MKKSVLLGTGILATALLTGCGGSSSDGAATVQGYDLSAYEGRSVSTDTLSGTWVVAGTGVYSYKDAVDSKSANYAVKEYFVITGDAASGYKKSSCESQSQPESIFINGSEMTAGNFTGTITENSRIVGVDKTSTEGDGFTGSEVNNLELIKISNLTAPFATLSASVPAGTADDLPISCFSQAKGTFKLNNYSTTFQEFNFFNDTTIEKYDGAEGFTALGHYIYNRFTEFDTDNIGDSVTFSHTIASSQSETLTFNASNNSDSVQGTLTITLP